MANKTKPKNTKKLVAKNPEVESAPKNTNKPWTDDEIKFLKKNIKMGKVELAKKLNRSKDAIHSKLRDIKLFKDDKRDKKVYKRFNRVKNFKPWTVEELDFIKKNITKSDNELAEELGRTRGSISQKKNDLKEAGLKKNTENAGVKWSEKELKLLVKNLKKTSGELADLLGRSKSSIETKLHKLRKKGVISYRI